MPHPTVTLPSTIRPIEASDIPAIKQVIDSTELFPSELLDDMVSGYLAGTAGADLWLTVDNGQCIAVAYAAPERLTSGTWNLYLIAVQADTQSQGVGARLMRHIEELLATQGARILIVETSGLASFARTRAFYSNIGYHEEARIRDFYDAGEDKVVFWKALQRARS